MTLPFAAQNIGLGICVPINTILIAEMFPPEELAIPLGLVIIPMYIGQGMSTVAIEVAEHIGWRNSTWFFVFFCGICLALMWRFVSGHSSTKIEKDHRDRQSRIRSSVRHASLARGGLGEEFSRPASFHWQREQRGSFRTLSQPHMFDSRYALRRWVGGASN